MAHFWKSFAQTTAPFVCLVWASVAEVQRIKSQHKNCYIGSTRNLNKQMDLELQTTSRYSCLPLTHISATHMETSFSDVGNSSSVESFHTRPKSVQKDTENGAYFKV